MRIVSLVPSLTELLIELGLGGQVVGRTGFCIHPKDAIRDIPKVGGTKTVDVARIRALAPTHLVVNREENPRDVVDQLREHIPHIVVTHPMTVQDNVRLYTQFGEIFERPGEARRLVQQFEQAQERLLCLELPVVRVLYLIWRNPWMTVASNTFISSMLAQVRLVTVPQTTDQQITSDAQRYPVVADDAFAVAGAQVVLMSSEPYRFSADDAVHINALPGMQRSHCLMIDGEMTSWYGSRAISGLHYLRQFRQRVDRSLDQAGDAS